MSNQNKKAEYKHFVEAKTKDDNFPGGYNFYLTDSLEQIEESFKSSKGIMSFDLETSSLDVESGFIVGYSYSFDGLSSYYVPVNHATGGLGTPALDLIYKQMQSAGCVFMFNMRFDTRFLEYHSCPATVKTESHILWDTNFVYGYDMSMIKTIDVAISVDMADSNITSKNLKWAAKHFLGWDMQTFAGVVGDNINFYYVTPEDATFYAATDALSTFQLGVKLNKYYKEGGLAAKNR